MEKVAYIITGANKGLGKAFFDLLLEKEGAVIISISRNINADQKIKLKTHKNFVYIKKDFSKLTSTKFLDTTLLPIISNSKRIVFINNAGVVEPIGGLGLLEEPDIVKAVFVNSLVPILFINFFMKKVKDKQIDFINITSGAANKTIPGWSLYCSTKAFTYNVFNSLEKQTSNNKNINVYNIDPGVIDTSMQEKIRTFDKTIFPLKDEFIKYKEDGKLRSPGEVAFEILKKTSTL